MAEDRAGLIWFLQRLLFLGSQSNIESRDSFLDSLCRTQPNDCPRNSFDERHEEMKVPSFAKTQAVAICAMDTPFSLATCSTRSTMVFPKVSYSFDASIPLTNPSKDRVVDSSRGRARIPPARGHHGMHLQLEHDLRGPHPTPDSLQAGIISLSSSRYIKLYWFCIEMNLVHPFLSATFWSPRNW
jgi:hypothetical protein